MTDPLDFSHFEEQFEQQAQVRQRTNLNLRFFVEPVQNQGKTLEVGRPIYDNVEMVGINVPGSKDEVVKKVNDEIKAKFGAQYDRWKRTQEQPVDGTPLSMVPWLNPAQIRELQALNIMTLEQLGSLSDTSVQKIGMGGLKLREKAQTYMKSGTDSAETQRLIARNVFLEAETKRMQEQLTAANNRYEALLQGGITPAHNGVDIAAITAAVMAAMKGQAQ
jgi:hypothetical protein